MFIDSDRNSHLIQSDCHHWQLNHFVKMSFYAKNQLNELCAHKHVFASFCVEFDVSILVLTDVHVNVGRVLLIFDEIYCSLFKPNLQTNFSIFDEKTLTLTFTQTY